MASIAPRQAGEICRIASHIGHGDLISFESNSIKNNKVFTFSAHIHSLGSIHFRHGKGIFGASSVIIDSTGIQFWHELPEPTLSDSFDHSLTIHGKTEIVLTVGSHATISISVTSGGNTFSRSGIRWVGTCGAIELESVNAVMEDASMVWHCTNYADPVWMFGDSYFTYYEARWPYYLAGKYDNFLLCGFPGAMSEQMYPDFRQALTHGTPKIAVWCLGMNDADPEDGINESWLQCTLRFIADCQSRGITPVLSTIPNVPERNHIFKNDFVRRSGLRYIDFASAVGATDAMSGWDEHMLSDDRVHPAVAGAKALANQVLLDLPEITD